jgi:hypothetical protein
VKLSLDEYAGKGRPAVVLIKGQNRKVRLLRRRARENCGKTTGKKAKVRKLDSNGLPTRVEPRGDVPAGVLKSFAQGGHVLHAFRSFLCSAQIE